MSYPEFLFHPPAKRPRRKPFDLQNLLTTAKVVAVELVATVVFFVWLFRILMHEFRWQGLSDCTIPNLHAQPAPGGSQRK